MSIDVSRFCVPEGRKLNLRYRSLLAEHVETLSDLQSRLYADDRYALLVILQAMDAAGKDGVIKHVMSGVNPRGRVAAAIQVDRSPRVAPSPERHANHQVLPAHLEGMARALSGGAQASTGQ